VLVSPSRPAEGRAGSSPLRRGARAPRTHSEPLRRARGQLTRRLLDQDGRRRGGPEHQGDAMIKTTNIEKLEAERRRLDREIRAAKRAAAKKEKEALLSAQHSLGVSLA